MSTVTDSQLIDFVYQEADLIDTQQLNEWEALFADDGHYWSRSRTARPIPFCRAR